MPPQVDLRDFQFMPLLVGRLFASDFNAMATDTEWRAAVTLWARSWHQVPAGSLPADEKVLAFLAGFGRDNSSWAQVKHVALDGFVLCQDGRYYHPVIAALALDAWDKKQAHRARTKNATEARRKHHEERNAQRNDERNDHQGTGRGTDKGTGRKTRKSLPAHAGGSTDYSRGMEKFGNEGDK